MRLLVLLCVLASASAILNVHLVPHTHDDVGWLKNVDQYYSGANNSIQHAGVRYILTTVVKALQANPERKFTYVEQAFFQRWWREQPADIQALTKQLVQNGQLNFVNGGWCMHDEAAAHYIDMIDQTTLGHRFLKEEFDYVPTVGWQLDPFGHSATQAALLSAEVGFDGLFFGRIDYQDLKLRQNESRCEFVWRASESLGPDAQVFAGLSGSYHGNYGPPSGFDWNVNSNDEPIEDNRDLETYNVPSRVNGFVAAALAQGAMTRGDHIMMTMGSDFQYEGAEDWFINLDKMIKHANEDGRINVLYSSPAEYTAAKLAEATKGSVTWPVDTGNNSDFFPYADGPHQFWTGYFTSRPALKRFTRVNSAFFNAARQVQSIGGAAISGVENLLVLEEAMGVNQHHDAVSGTSKQHVAFDYAKRESEGKTAAETLILRVLGAKFGQSWLGSGGFCERLNETVCSITQRSGATTTIAVWNQLGQARTEMLRVPVDSQSVTVVTDVGQSVAVQVQPAGETITNYQRDTNEAKYEAIFQADLAPASVTVFKLVASAPTGSPTSDFVIAPPLQRFSPNEDVTLENDFLQLVFSNTTGRLSSWTNKKTGTQIDVDQTFCFYRSSTGDQTSGQKSGAYIFRPEGSNPGCQPLDAGDGTAQITRVIKGPLVQEVTQVFSNYITQTVRLAAGERHAEFTFTVGEIPIEDPLANKTEEQCIAWRQTQNCDPNGPPDPKNDKPCSAFIAPGPSGYCECYGGRRANPISCGQGGFTCEQACKYYIGKEVVSRFTTNIASAGRLLTDSNGREMLFRQRNYRPTWPLQQTEQVAGNYFPVDTAAAIYDDARQLTILVDSAQAGGSIEDGQLELMVHRRVLEDDGRGVGEPLNETQFITSYASSNGGAHYGPGLIIRGRHFVTLEPPATAARVWRPLQERIYGNPVMAFADNSTGTGFSFVSAALPLNVQLMTMQSLNSTSILLRLAHLFGIGEDSEFSQPASVDLSTLLNPSTSGFKITGIQEMSLTNNQQKSEILIRRQRNMLWTQDKSKPHPWRNLPPVSLADPVATLGPLEIKTFLLTVERQSS